MNCYNFIDDDTIILFDDFTNKKHYHIILKYFSIIEHGGRLVVLKKIKNDICYKHIINKYQEDPR